MNKHLVLLLVLFVALLSTGTVFAETQENVIISWDYENPPSDLKDFDLRVNEDSATLITISKDAREWVGDLVFKDGVNVLDMRAKDEAGNVSVWSEPCLYNPPPATPSSVVVKVVVTVTINE